MNSTPRSRLGIGGKLAGALLALMLLQQAFEVLSDNRFTTKIIDIHGRAKMNESEAALRAAYGMLNDDAKQRLQELTREPRFKAVIKLGDSPTLSAQLRELLAEQRAAVATFTRPDGVIIASASRPPELPTGDFAKAVASLVTDALSGSADAVWKIWSGRPIACVSVPVVIDGDLIGALTLGSEITDQTLKLLKDVTGAEIVILGRQKVIRSSPGLVISESTIGGHFERSAGRPARKEPSILVFEGNSYFVAQQAMRLSSSEDSPTVALLVPAEEYIGTSDEFVSDSIVRNSINMLVAALFVVFLVTRLTGPIRELRLATERVASGELTHRVPVASGDELGQLAAAFNTMAGRIAESQRQLADANASLEHQVTERTRSLQEQVRRRESAEQELHRHAAVLEQRVRERTAEIEQALATLDGISDATIIFEESSLRLTFVNQGACIQFNRPRDSLLGTTYSELIESVGAAEIPSILESAKQRAPAVLQFTAIHVRRNGSPVPVEVNLQYSAPEGREACFIAISRDITERRDLEERRNRTQRMEVLGTMASGVAHDLNNALSPIAISIEMLRAKYPQDAATLDMLEQCSRRGASMVRQLLTFARGREGERTTIDAVRLVNEMAQIVRSTFPRNIRLEIENGRSVWEVDGDATQLHQVLLNLCVNARDAMPDGGTLRLGVRNAEIEADLPDCVNEPKGGRYVCLMVADNGTGMPPHVRARIFDPFFTTKPPGKGSGLGLSTVLGIIRSHGGVLRLESAPGKGSLFEVYVPAKLKADESPAAEAAAAAGNEGTGRRVLLVDDERLIRESCAAALTGLGYEVVVADNGAEALRVAGAPGNGIAVVITDLDMPLLGGRGLIEALRAVLPSTPIIVTSGVVTEDESGNLLKDPRVKAVIQKPFSLTQLVRAVEDSIRTAAGGPPSSSPAA